MLTALGRFVLSVFWNFFAVPTFFIIILVIILATYGFSFGIRRFYVNCLLKVFEVRFFILNNEHNYVNFLVK